MGKFRFIDLKLSFEFKIFIFFKKNSFQNLHII